MKKLIKDSSAVSDVLGEILMTTVAVILIGSIAVSIFSYGGPDDSPHTQVNEWIDVETDTIYLENSGGEFIDTGDLEIVVNVNGIRYTYSSSNISENLGNKNSWELGDRIEINTSSNISSGWNLNIQEGDEVDIYLIDKPSKKVFQKLRLSTGEN
ncbi:type IV pilin N-terminal domain-containing protein [Methanosarcina hadiensis]|uniref:type IV pilin N-terminal domain-containing protein n=1 Tax=Methanosarcina hadiensis TaxID=3078083 RepID=UPI0039774CF1